MERCHRISAHCFYVSQNCNRREKGTAVMKYACTVLPRISTVVEFCVKTHFCVLLRSRCLERETRQIVPRCFPPRCRPSRSPPLGLLGYLRCDSNVGPGARQRTRKEAKNQRKLLRSYCRSMHSSSAAAVCHFLCWGTPLTSSLTYPLFEAAPPPQNPPC